MNLLSNRSIKIQYGISTSLVILVASFCFLLSDLVGYQVAALLLLVTVSVLAMFFEIAPVLVAAILSALIWDFFFIPPRFTFTVGTTEDRVLLLTYFIIVSLHAVLTSRIRQVQRLAQKKEERAKQLKFYNTLFNSLSHELRTPITTIMAATDNLQADDHKLSPESRTVLLNEITIASTRLNRQVENLLSMSRLESGVIQIRKDWCDVRELIYTTLQAFDALVVHHRVTVFVSETLPLVKLDFGLIEQVLHNLIGNAIQHTPAGTDIIIKADVVEEKLIVSVSDTGKGFPQHVIHRVFDKFFRVEGSKPGGTGLGLSIAKGFVEAHQGTIQLRNLPLSGAEFTIEIPTEVTYLNRLKNE